MRYCPHCGAEVNETAKFCNICGTPLSPQRPVGHPIPNTPSSDFSNWEQPSLDSDPFAPPPTILDSAPQPVQYPAGQNAANFGPPVVSGLPGLAPYEMYADNGPRFGAYIIDTLIVTGGGILAGVLFAPVLSVITDEALALAIITLLGAVTLAWSLGYYTYFHSTSGQTIGKKAMGLRVVRRNGSRLTWQRALWRAFAFFIFPTLLSYVTCGLGWFINLMPLFHSEHRALHDLLADTWVIQD